MMLDTTRKKRGVGKVYEKKKKKKRISCNKKHIGGCKIPYLYTEGKGIGENELATQGKCPGGTVSSRILNKDW